MHFCLNCYQEASLRWQAHRSTGEWFVSILESLGGRHNDEILSKFISCDTSSVAEGLPVNEPWFTEEKERLNVFFNLLVELASARAWSQMPFVNVPPYNFAAVLHEDSTIAQQHMEHCRVSWHAILAAESASSPGRRVDVLNRDVKKAVTDRLRDISFQSFQVTREVMALCEECGWKANHPSLQKLAQRMFGGPCETKFSLEDLFAHLTSVAKLSNLTTPFNKCLCWTKAQLLLLNLCLKK